MSRISFKNDYSEGAHPDILEQLLKTNFDQQIGYGDDEYSVEARKLIQEKTGKPDAKVYFTSGGTQANLLVISHLLKTYESVITVNTGHIAVHETGAIEATGHKVNVVESLNGKIGIKDIKEVVNSHNDEHMVKPAMVYISNATELGSVYTKQELTELSDFCLSNNLLLFMDGARIGAALTSGHNDLTLAEIADLVDVFYIGGTKNGALLGEAIVFVKQGLDDGFKYHLKQKGALLAKGRILGIQFLELFKNDLFLQLAQHSNTLAQQIGEAFQKHGFDFFLPPQSNQIFPILPNSLIEKLHERFDFYIWYKVSQDRSAIRIVTSWATRQEHVNELITYIKP